MRLSGIVISIFTCTYIKSVFHFKQECLDWEGHYNLCYISSDCIYELQNINGQNICLNYNFHLVRGFEPLKTPEQDTASWIERLQVSWMVILHNQPFGKMAMTLVKEKKIGSDSALRRRSTQSGITLWLERNACWKRISLHTHTSLSETAQIRTFTLSRCSYFSEVSGDKLYARRTGRDWEAKWYQMKSTRTQQNNGVF